MINESDDPLLWWEVTGKTKYPLLYELAIKSLIVTATSVPSERVFSTAGHVFNEKRRRLDPEKLDMIVSLHTNMD